MSENSAQWPIILGVRPLLWRPHSKDWALLLCESKRAKHFSVGEIQNLSISGLCSWFHTEKPQPREGKSLFQGHTGACGIARTRTKIGIIIASDQSEQVVWTKMGSQAWEWDSDPQAELEGKTWGECGIGGCSVTALS